MTVSCEEVAGIRVHLRLEPAAASARRARRFVSEILATWGEDGCADAASLLVSELVTNAVIHARSPVELVVGRGSPSTLRFEVYDSSARVPRVRGFDPESVSGRGLALVEAMSERWGVETGITGKHVWFELQGTDRGAHLAASQA